MGLLRFILALAVLSIHSGKLLGIPFLPGNIAVEAFFIISGFYMSMIITEKYSKLVNGYKLFITNRFMRLYPIYWIVLILSVAFSMVVFRFSKSSTDVINDYITYQHLLNPLSWIYIISTNIIIIGQDILLFLKATKTGYLTFTINPFTSSPKLYQFLFIQPGWSLGIEIVFYIISPFFIKIKSRILVGLILLIAAVKFIAYINGYSFDPWNYRFFPFELMWFLIGIISYRIYLKTKQMKIKSSVKYIVFSGAIFSTLFLNVIDFSKIIEILYLLYIAFSIPIIFNLTKTFKFDRWIGDFSYPVYISHLLFTKIALILLPKLGISNSLLSSIVVISTCVFSYVLIELVGNKIERYRARRVKDQQQQS
jgi:peptidoglycan/LPS O-acetylase OafA/YrhL